MPQTKSAWDEFPVVAEGNAAAADIDGAGGWNSFAPANDAGRATAESPAIPRLTVAGSPAANPPVADAGLQPAETEVRMGDGAGKSGPNLQLTPEEDDHYKHILATDPMDKAAANARAYLKLRGYNFQDNFDTVIDQRRKGLGVLGNTAYGAPGSLNPRQPSDDRAFFEGAGEGATLGGAGKILSAIDATSTAIGLGGNGDPNQSWLNNYRGTLDSYEAQRNSDKGEHPYLYGAGTIAGSLAMPTGIGTAAERAGYEAGANALRTGATQEEARIVANLAARRAATTRGAIEGTGYGAATGVVSADNLPDAIQGGITGGIVGGTLGAAGTAIGGRLSAPSLSAVDRAATPTANEFTDAAERQGIDYLAADRPGAYGSQFATSIVNSTLGAIPITEGASRALDTLKGARDRVSSAVGNFRTTEGGAADTVYAGQRIIKGVLNAVSGNQRKATALYDAIPIPQTAPASLDNTRAALADLTQGFDSNAALSKLWADNPRLEATKSALAPPNAMTGSTGGNLSWGDLKRFRTIVGEIIGKPGLENDGNQVAAMRKLYGSLSEDMRTTAEEGGPASLRAFERANGFYNAAQNRKESVFSAILGKNYDNSPEDAYRAVKGWANSQGGDFSSLAQLVRSLPQDDADALRATIFNSMGRANKGAQDATGSVFSPANFVTDWNGLSSRAKNVLFQGEHRRAIDDIVAVASGMKGSAKYANTSKTGIAVGATATFGSFMANPVLATLGIAGQFGAGKLLGSPRFAKWLASLGRKPNPEAIRDHIGRLAVVARAEPQIANNIFDLQRRLTDAFSDKAPLRAAAQEDQGNSSVTDWDSPQYESEDYGADPAASNDPAPQPAPDPSADSPYADAGTDGNNADWTGQ